MMRPLIATFAALMLVTVSPAAAQGDDPLTDRELAGIVEEQALLLRQLQTLRGTMEVLVQRIEAEGRTHTAELLRDAIALLDERRGIGDEGSHLTLEERMDQARTAARAGRLAYSLEQQNQLIAELERLLDILHDRKNLDALEDRIQELKQLEAALGELANEERDLREETEALRERASNDAQKELEASLRQMLERQRSLLSETEQQGRESGTLELEQLERALEALIEAQRTDEGMLAAWSPVESEELTASQGSIETARQAETRGARLDEAAEALRATAARLRSEGATDMEEIEAMLAEAADRAARHERVSEDPAAGRAAEGYRRAGEAVEAARTGATPAEEAARSLEEEATALAREAEEARAPAAEARREAMQDLEELAQRPTAAGVRAEDVQRALAEAQSAAEEGADPSRARAATEAAARALEQAKKDLDFLGEALSATQAELGRQTESLERGLSTLPQGETEEGQAARAALEEAAQGMEAASEAARREEAPAAAEAARQAREALERAQAALGKTREAAAAASAEQSSALASQQQQAAQDTASMGEKTGEASMNPEAQQNVEESLARAAEAQEQASQELSEGRTSSAAESQRQAMQQLQQALSKAEAGVTPQSEEDRARAEELAAEQERIREKILDLARRLEERENPRPTPNMERAQEAAQQASESLEQGDLSEAEEREEEVERELRETREELEEEEEQYQRLRQEEALFRIAEEVRTLAAGHIEEMTALAELDGERTPGSSVTRAQRLRLRRIARGEGALASRASEIAEAIEAEQAFVSAQLMRDVQGDMERIAIAVSEQGDFETGERTQALGRDVLENLEWLAEALRQEQARRQQEQQQQGQQQGQQGENVPSTPPLIPDATELKLLRRMEVELQEAVKEMLALYPELEEGGEVNELVLEDITRLANRHEQITLLFQAMRARIGLDAPPDEDGE